jgi:hypothetical protein
MLSFYENRGGKNLPKERKQALETAKTILRKKETKSTPVKAARRSARKTASRTA